MTEEDYIIIAKIIKQNTYDKNGLDVVYKKGLMSDLCIVLHQDNNNFDMLKFKEACQ